MLEKKYRSLFKLFLAGLWLSIFHSGQIKDYYPTCFSTNAPDGSGEYHSGHLPSIIGVSDRHSDGKRLKPKCLVVMVERAN